MKIRNLHDFCTKCNKLVTNPKSKCGIKQVFARNCSFKDKHKKQSRVWSPAERKIKTKVWATKDPQEYVSLHLAFQEEVKTKKHVTKKVKRFPTLLAHCMTLYIDWLEDTDLPEHEHKNLSNDYINTIRKHLKRFGKCAGMTTPINVVDNVHVGKFHTSLSKYAPKTYNHHIQGLRTFFNWLQSYGYEIENPFKHTKFKYVVKSPQIILEEELTDMLKIITPENGLKKADNTRQSRNYYKPWLKHAIGLFLLTGERRDGIFYLKWEHQEGNYLKIPNYKINRKEKIREIKEYRDLLITPDLADLLLKIGGSEGYILCPERTNRDQVKNECSRAFTHFWKVAGHKEKRKLSHLRKTYVTRMRVILGDLAKTLKINKEDTQIDYYISQKEVQKKIEGKRIFNIEF